ncbi:hypothetical protein TCDM_11838 [Trypanosoma cruzi Dm28c]|uniref:Uncharacterized protein n=1 Tax=Trypanosoma cruzi Dm28c TaxID=1416333 RepID=V5B3V6_TRYCR|nr:hypothetical protein TCDM_11838 [Trypanosoma cruzi Dm28c]
MVLKPTIPQVALVEVPKAVNWQSHNQKEYWCKAQPEWVRQNNPGHKYHQERQTQRGEIRIKRKKLKMLLERMTSRNRKRRKEKTMGFSKKKRKKRKKKRLSKKMRNEKKKAEEKKRRRKKKNVTIRRKKR